MQAQNPARASGTIKARQKDAVVVSPGHAYAENPTGKIDKNASAEKNGAATINPPRPKTAPKIPGSTQTTAIKEKSNVVE
jgi:hypothetical protein